MGSEGFVSFVLQGNCLFLSGGHFLNQSNKDWDSEVSECGVVYRDEV